MNYIDEYREKQVQWADEQFCEKWDCVCQNCRKRTEPELGCPYKSGVCNECVNTQYVDKCAHFDKCIVD